MPGLGHIAVGMAAGRLHSRWQAARSPVVAMVAFTALSAIHDADLIGFSFGIPYDAPYGHRGASHSIFAGLLLGILAGCLGRIAGWAWGITTVLACGVAVSHGLLDTLTDGGRGIALLWPLSTERFFSPWQPLPVSPLGMGVFSWWGLRVLLFELVVFSPLWLFALWPRKR
ncbi:MAG: metal-dependent hydrolase [Acidobacteriota bacterium]